jgi:uncharacterized membrane protein
MTAPAETFRPGAISLDSGRRLDALDAARGAAMLLVCLSHFTSVYFRVEYESSGHLLPVQIAMLASPTFIALSGMMIGLMSVLYRKGFNNLRIKLADRAIFLLTVGHVLIMASRLAFERDPMNAVRMTVITDVVGVCVLAGVWLVPKLPSRARVVLALLVFAVAWWMEMTWQPSQQWLLATKEIFVGGDPTRVMWYTYPVMQWLAVYIAATALGEYIGRQYAHHGGKVVERRLLLVGLAAVSAGVLLRVMSWPFRPALTGRMATWQWEPFFSPWSKLTAGPVYVLFFGGLGMLVVTAIMMASHRQIAEPVLGILSKVGRASLAVFVFQNYVYYGGFGWLNLTPGQAWPILFLISLLPILWFAAAWDKRQLNSKLTVGLSALLTKRRRPDHGAAAHPPRSAEGRGTS